MAKIQTVEISPLNLPLRETFRTALGQKNITQNVLVILNCGGGIKGYGEASSSLAMPEATQEAMRKVLLAASPRILGASLSNWEEICQDLTRRNPDHPTAMSALECALLDAFCKYKKMSMAHFFGGNSRPIETDYTIGALKPNAAGRIARSMLKKGFSKFKVKITGKNLAEDLNRIETVARCCGGRSILIDANQGLTEKTARRLMTFICKNKIGVDLIEQPFPKKDIQSHRNLRRLTPHMIAVDESLRTFADAKKILEADAADVFNIKIARMGLLEAMRTAKYVWSRGKKLMIGCMMESTIGLSTAVQWAVGSGQFSFVDLDSFLLLKDLPHKAGFSNRGPMLSVKPKVLGSGVHD